MKYTHRIQVKLSSKDVEELCNRYNLMNDMTLVGLSNYIWDLYKFVDTLNDRVMGQQIDSLETIASRIKVLSDTELTEENILELLWNTAKVNIIRD